MSRQKHEVPGPRRHEFLRHGTPQAAQAPGDEIKPLGIDGERHRRFAFCDRRQIVRRHDDLSDVHGRLHRTEGVFYPQRRIEGDGERPKFPLGKRRHNVVKKTFGQRGICRQKLIDINPEIREIFCKGL